MHHRRSVCSTQTSRAILSRPRPLVMRSGPPLPCLPYPVAGLGRTKTKKRGSVVVHTVTSGILATPPEDLESSCEALAFSPSLLGSDVASVGITELAFNRNCGTDPPAQSLQRASNSPCCNGVVTQKKQGYMFRRCQGASKRSSGLKSCGRMGG